MVKDVILIYRMIDTILILRVEKCRTLLYSYFYDRPPSIDPFLKGVKKARPAISLFFLLVKICSKLRILGERLLI